MAQGAGTNVGGNWRRLAGFYAKSRQVGVNGAGQGGVSLYKVPSATYYGKASSDHTVVSTDYDTAYRGYDATATYQLAASNDHDTAYRGLDAAPAYELTASTGHDKPPRGEDAPSTY